MRLFDWLAPARRCVVLGCADPPNGRSNLCVTHERELDAKIKRVVERVRVKQPEPLPRLGSDA